MAAVQSPSLEKFKSSVDGAPRDVAYGGLGNAGEIVGLDDLRRLFQLNYSVTLIILKQTVI